MFLGTRSYVILFGLFTQVVPDVQRSAEFPDWDDLVLVRMSSPVVYTKRVRPIRLPYPGQNFQQNAICLISGFGKLQGKCHYSTIDLALHSLAEMFMKPFQINISVNQGLHRSPSG